MSDGRPASERQPLFGYLGCSFLLHGGVVVMGLLSPLGAMLGAALVPSCNEPVIHDAMVVSVVSLPKRLSVPDRAARVKVAAGQTSPEPPPVKQSDLIIHKDTPEPTPGNVEEARRQEILEQIKRQQLLQQLEDAPDGPKDRDPTDPNGTAENLENAVLGVQAQGDPVFARWVKSVEDLTKPKFHPLGTSSGLVCVVTAKIDVDTGEVESYEITSSSGVLSFDSTAERVLADTPRVPPPPEKYRSLVADEGVPIRFKL